MSGRLSGSPPVNTNTGTCMAAMSSISRFASSVFSSSGLRAGWAQARQCNASQVAGLGSFPNCYKGPLIEIDAEIHGFLALRITMPEMSQRGCDLGHVSHQI